jgi:tetratricopeptide (TPR) repeat protein
MFERKYQEVLAALDILSYDFFEAQHFLFHKNLAYAQAYTATKDVSRMRSHADRARTFLETSLQGHTDDPRYHAALGLAYAYLGRKQDAVREGTQAVSLLPVSKDAAMGPIYVLNLAKIFTIVGEHEKAIERLEYLFSVPSYEYLWHIVSGSCLKLDPTWDPLRGRPRFQQMLEQN